jgi:hypothetical protein
MSEPRHAMIYRDGYKKQWWLGDGRMRLGSSVL